jgi:uncharacterized membrane protein
MKIRRPQAARPAGLRGAGDLRAIDLAIGAVMRWGVVLSAAIIVLGIVFYVTVAGPRVILLSPPGVPPGVRTNPDSLAAVLRELSSRQPAAVTDLGLLLLIATPVLSVAIATVAFGLERDWLYAGIGLIVFAMLMISFALGKA